MGAPLRKDSFDDPVTTHLRANFARLRPELTVGVALEGLRRQPPPGRILYLYVVDEDDRLCGVVPLHRLLLSPADALIADVMVQQVITLSTDSTVLDAGKLFLQHRLLAFPVVDAQGRMLGVVEAETYTGELSDLSSTSERNDLFQRVGVYLARGQQASALLAFRSRFPWLGCNLAAGLLAAFLSARYEDDLNRVVALAFFIPVVLNLAESVSSQSVSLSLQALHGQRPTWRGLLQGVHHELRTGLLLGLGAGGVVALAALAWLGQWRVAFCLLGGIAGGVAGAAALGMTLPLLLRLLRLEPRIAAGPVALAGADVITLFLYLTLAHWLLS
jgi:magnesium transporter